MSSIKTINYNTPLQSVFVHDALEVLIGSDAQLIARPLDADELLVATGRKTQAADLGSSLPVFLRGTASWDAVNGYDLSGGGTGNYISLNDDAGQDGITPLSPNAHFNFPGGVGTIRFKVTPQYSGTPAGDRYFFGTANSVGGVSGEISLRHTFATGDIHLFTNHDTLPTVVDANVGNWVPVAGVEYEFELNYFAGGTVAGLFIDGFITAGGFVAVVDTVPNRDIFVLGDHSSKTGSSDSIIRDLQIFNSFKHAFPSFPSEIPRIVNLYPLESIIEPQDFSKSEGFDGFSNVETLNGDSAIQYAMKINNSYYYLVANVLTISDQSLAQSNTQAEWTSVAGLAAVTAFISTGADITMLPILSSGPFGLYTPELVSDTIEYDFFAIPASCTNCVLYGFINDNCDPITSGTVRVRTTKPILTQGHLQAFDETVDMTPATGYFDIELVIPNLPTDRGDTYLFEAKWLDGDGKSWSYTKKISIPNQASALLRDVVIL